MKLVIGNKNYSSWSLRPWLLLDAFNIEFEEVGESLRAEELTSRLQKHSASGRVPVLIDGDLTVWDSLAICEYISENCLSDRGWPENKNDRAVARAVCAEMHAGFSALRMEMPMNCRAKRRVELSAAAKNDIARVDSIWSAYARRNNDGELRLFGEFSIADCFFAPVVMRFKTYGVTLSTNADAYFNSMLAHPSLVTWVGQALLETEIVPEDEAGVDS